MNEAVVEPKRITGSRQTHIRGGRIAIAGVVTGFSAILVALSYSALIFSGPLDRYMGIGVGIALLSAATLGAFIPLRSSYAGTVAGVASPAAILGLIVASIQENSGLESGDPRLIATVLVAIPIATLLCGLMFVVIGRFQLGNLIRYIPYPVMAGFLGGVGWLLLQGALPAMSGLELTRGNFAELCSLPTLWTWMPGCVLGVVLWVLGLTRPNYWSLPVLLLAAAAGVWAVGAANGLDAEALRANGLLLGPFPDGALWSPTRHFNAIAQTQWELLIPEIPKASTMLMVGLIGVLLVGPSLELTLRQDIDLNRELGAAGVGNLVTGLGGGLPGFQNLGGSMLVHFMGAPHRLVGIVGALMSAALLFAGANVLNLVPKIMPGILLFSAGLGFLYTWVVEPRRKLPFGDYAVVLLVFLTVVFVGFMEGVGVGIVAGTILFAINYSRIAVVKSSLTGLTFRSNVDRADSLRAQLGKHGDKIMILRLQGFLFFGTANRLTTQIRDRLLDAERPVLQYLILDFKLVNGIDSSSAVVFRKLMHMSEDREFTVITTALPDEVHSALEREQLIFERAESEPAQERSGRIQVFPDLDQGLEWCEDRLLLSENGDQDLATPNLSNWLRQSFSEPQVDRLISFMQKVSFAPREALIKQGEASSNLLFVDVGTVSIEIQTDTGRTIRVRTMGAGTAVGEIAFYLGLKRSASVVALTDGVVYSMGASSLDQMVENEPELAAAFHQFMARMLSGKLADTSRVLAAVVD